MPQHESTSLVRRPLNECEHHHDCVLLSAERGCEGRIGVNKWADFDELGALFADQEDAGCNEGRACPLIGRMTTNAPCRNRRCVSGVEGYESPFAP